SIPEDTIEPYLDPPHLEDISIDPAHAKEVFDQLVIINLTGGLGTSMGMDKAKSLLPVRDVTTFLDIIVEQVLAARRGTFSRLPRRWGRPRRRLCCRCVTRRPPWTSPSSSCCSPGAVPPPGCR